MPTTTEMSTVLEAANAVTLPRMVAEELRAFRVRRPKLR